VLPGRAPVVLPSGRRSALLVRLKQLAGALCERDQRVLSANVFRAIVMPPTAAFFSYVKERGASLHIPRFDVLLLIQTTSQATAREVQTTHAYGELLATIRDNAQDVYVMAARNARRIADADTTRRGLFLFNHFVAENAPVMLELWEYLADWYVKETGLRNSVALVPTNPDRSDYTIVNWARWEVSPIRHFWHSFSKRSFWHYVTANLEENRAASMPIYCRLA
jgi:hypothetical protein